jgi:hypothetical protein
MERLQARQNALPVRLHGLQHQFCPHHARQLNIPTQTATHFLFLPAQSAAGAAAASRENKCPGIESPEQLFVAFLALAQHQSQKPLLSMKTALQV